MTSWIFEPGHTELAFRAPHMMVTWVRGLFKDVHGRREFDWDDCLAASVEGEADVTIRGNTRPVSFRHRRRNTRPVSFDIAAG